MKIGVFKMSCVTVFIYPCIEWEVMHPVEGKAFWIRPKSSPHWAQKMDRKIHSYPSARYSVWTFRHTQIGLGASAKDFDQIGMQSPQKSYFQIVNKLTFKNQLSTANVELKHRLFFNQFVLINTTILDCRDCAMKGTQLVMAFAAKIFSSITVSNKKKKGTAKTAYFYISCFLLSFCLCWVSFCGGVTVTLKTRYVHFLWREMCCLPLEMATSSPVHFTQMIMFNKKPKWMKIFLF